MTAVMRRGALALTMLTACAEVGEGTLEVRIWGEAFIEEEIPADVFNDGWSVVFSRFVIVVDGIATDDATDPGRYAFDLRAPSAGEGHGAASLVVPAGAQSLAYRVGPGATATGGNATAADAAMMSAMGYAVFVEGTATRDAATIDFAWGFDADTEYRECEVVEEVPTDGTATTVMTIHADHVFYDDLDSPEPNVSFDLIAASDADADGTVTEAELRARDISAEARYQVGSRPIDDLWAFMAAQIHTLGHIDGEGHCAF